MAHTPVTFPVLPTNATARTVTICTMMQLFSITDDIASEINTILTANPRWELALIQAIAPMVPQPPFGSTDTPVIRPVAIFLVVFTNNGN